MSTKEERLQNLLISMDKRFENIVFIKTIKAVYEQYKNGMDLDLLVGVMEDDPRLTPEINARKYNQVFISCDALKKNPDISCNDLINLLIQD